MTTSRTLLTFAYIADQFAKSGDIGDGLLKLFAPVIAKRKGKNFDPSEFAADVLELYDIEMHPYVAEDFAPRLAAAGYLIPTATFAQNAVYQNGDFDLPEIPISLQALEALLDRFADSATDLLITNDLAIPRDTLKSGLLDRLVQPDFLGLMVRPDRASLVPRKLSLTQDTPQDRPEDGDRLRLDYLSARFILDCIESSPSDFELLVAISSGALATEVVLSLQSPPGIGEYFADVKIVLDGPLIMDALGFGQDGPVKYSKLLIEAIKRAQATPVVFLHTITEIEGAIRTPLENFERGQEVYGHLGRKLLKNRAFAPYLRSVLGKLSEHIQALGVNVLPFSDLDRSVLRKVLTETNEDRLAGAIGSYAAVESKLRDARSVADVLRIRGFAKAKSLSDCGLVFVTRNARLARLSRRFLINEGMMAREYFPPCITDRYLAGLFWITQGGGGGQLSRERLIANCTSAVMPRRDVITKMHRFLSDLNADMALRFDALMTNERAEHFLMDRTLADITLINEGNLEEIYRDVERIAGERVAAEKDSTIAELQSAHSEERAQTREDHERQLNEAHERASSDIRAEAARAVELEGQVEEQRHLAELAADDVRTLRATEQARITELVQRCVSHGKKAAQKARFRIAVGMIMVSIALGLATHFVPGIASSTSQSALWTVLFIALSQGFSVINYFKYPEAALAKYVNRSRDNALLQRARDLNIENAISGLDIDWNTDRVVARSIE